jgi:hypothetical protein
MILSKETDRSGQQYYTAKPGTTRPWQEIVTWCAQTYGPPGSPSNRWHRNDIVKGGKLWFKNEQDLMWFNLKWA